MSDLSRSESPVRLTMLFDNSGSFDMARSFEKHAAQQFFRRVLRPADEAAIYSVESDSYLAQPMTRRHQKSRTDDRVIWQARRLDFAFRRHHCRRGLPATVFRPARHRDCF